MPNQIAGAGAESSTLAIGLAFDRNRINAVLVDETGRIIAERNSAMIVRTTRAALGEMAARILELASAPERGTGEIKSIGLSANGLVDPPTGRVTMEGIKGWTRVDVKRGLEEGLADSGADIRMPVGRKHARAEKKASAHPSMAIHSRLAAIAAGEAWCGAARGKENVIYLSIAESIHAGILVDGRALRGASGQAGAAGWMALTQDFKPEYESYGCFSAEAGPLSFHHRAIEEWSGIADSLLGGLIKSDPTAIDAAMILKSAQGNDSLAIKVVNATCAVIGRGMANLISLFNPQAVVLGGEVGQSLTPYLDEIREAARRWAQPGCARECKIISANLGEKAAALGAAKLSLR